MGDIPAGGALLGGPSGPGPGRCPDDQPAWQEADTGRGATGDPGQELLSRDPPPEIAFAEAAASLSPMALSFWQECRRVRNDKLKRQLGVTLLYPSYREGLRALNAGLAP